MILQKLFNSKTWNSVPPKSQNKTKQTRRKTWQDDKTNVDNDSRKPYDQQESGKNKPHTTPRDTTHKQKTMIKNNEHHTTPYNNKQKQIHTHNIRRKGHQHKT